MHKLKLFFFTVEGFVFGAGGGEFSCPGNQGSWALWNFSFSPFDVKRCCYSDFPPAAPDEPVVPVEEMLRLKLYGTAEAFCGTVKAADPFDPEQDCKRLREAMRGVGAMIPSPFAFYVLYFGIVASVFFSLVLDHPFFCLCF